MLLLLLEWYVILCENYGGIAQPNTLDLKSYMRVVVSECDDFLIAYVLTTGPRANQNPSFTWFNDLQVTANQIILHIFREQSRGLHSRLATVNHKHRFFQPRSQGLSSSRPSERGETLVGFFNFSQGREGLYTGYHCLANQLFVSADSPLPKHDILLNLTQ